MARDDDPTLKLIRENKRLKNENRALRKAVRKLAKGKDRLPILEEIAEEAGFEESVQEDFSPKCPSCDKPGLQTTDLGARKLHTCSSCGFRVSVKK
jgi:hypothetical protein